jgi:tetratricopeptide (TPR) repeat protein
VLSGAIVSLLAIVPMVGRAQDPVTRELIKPGPAEPRPRPVCGAIRPSETPTAANRDRARDASQRGQQAALLGDGATAIRVLREAATLDPTAADVAFQLAGVYETARDSVNAVKEYCRFLSLAPTSPEARTVVDKIRILAPPRIEQVIDLPLAVFRSGIAAYRRGELTTADSAFSAAIAGDTAWADAYYNRGRVRLLLGDRQRAGTDFAQYLRLNPEARDRLDVSNELATLGLGEYSFSPLQTLAWGILIPSAGEFYTHRPIRGILTLLGVGGSAAMAFQERTTGRRTEHPYLIAGLVTAGAVWLVSAVDATIYARNSVDKQRRVAFIVAPGTSGGLVAQVSLSR